MEIRIVKMSEYRGMDREIEVSDFKTIKSKKSFNSLIKRWADYTEIYYTSENLKEIYFLSKKLMEKLADNDIECEIILCTKEKGDYFLGEKTLFLGIDVIFDGGESVLKNFTGKRNILNKNCLCDNTTIAKEVINKYSNNADYPAKYFELWRIYLLK